MRHDSVTPSSSSASMKFYLVPVCPYEYNEIIQEAIKISPNVELKDKKNAQYYVNTMKKIAESGKSWIKTEIIRLESLLESGISDEKKREIQKRTNIVHQFDRDAEEPDL